MYPVPEFRSSRIAMLFCCYVLFSIRFAQAQCIASGPNSPTSSSSVAFAGSDYSFNNPSNTLLNDGNDAVAASILSLSFKQTEYLQAKGFGFSIPTAATICGIEVNVVRSADNVLLNLAKVVDYDVRVMKSGSPVGSNLADVTTEWSSSEVTATYGGTNQLWGTTWAPADINSGNFGISFSAQIKGTISLFPDARINYISMTVYYLDPTLLPDQLVQITVANGTSNSALLSWKPDNIDESVSFSVERSINGAQWETVNGSLQKNNRTLLYTLSDAKPLPGKSFYRLKMLAASGAIRYSKVIAYELTPMPALKCYPNPITSLVMVEGVTAGSPVTVTNLLGQQVYKSSPALNNTVSFNFNELQPGIYVISAGNRKIKVQKK